MEAVRGEVVLMSDHNICFKMCKNKKKSPPSVECCQNSET